MLAVWKADEILRAGMMDGDMFVNSFHSILHFTEPGVDRSDMYVVQMHYI